jgi:hypothetical protein
MLGILLVGLAIMAALKYFGKMEGFQAMGPSPRRPTMRPPPGGAGSPIINEADHKELDAEWKTAGCPNQQLFGQLHGMINRLPQQKASVISELNKFETMAKNPNCLAAIQKFKQKVQSKY